MKANSRSHYLRVARALALSGGLALGIGGCAAEDADEADEAEVVDDEAVGTSAEALCKDALDPVACAECVVEDPDSLTFCLFPDFGPMAPPEMPA